MAYFEGRVGRIQISVRSAIQFLVLLFPKELVEWLGSRGKSGLCSSMFELGSPCFT